MRFDIISSSSRAEKALCVGTNRKKNMMCPVDGSIPLRLLLVVILLLCLSLISSLVSSGLVGWLVGRSSKWYFLCMMMEPGIRTPSPPRVGGPDSVFFCSKNLHFMGVEGLNCLNDNDLRGVFQIEG